MDEQNKLFSFIAKNKGFFSWIFYALFSLPIILLIQLIFPTAIPFQTFEFFRNNHILPGIIASLPIFLWGIALNILLALINRKQPINYSAERILVVGTIVSIIAGLFEELIFRWIVFFFTIITLKFMNWIFFEGWLGFGILEFVHNWIVGPIVNFVTLGKMKWLIFDMGWTVGAAAIAANAKFRNEHQYLGICGLINSWIIGFFMFWIMFNYGLWTAIIVHFLYDMAIYIVQYIECLVKQNLSPIE